MSSLTNSTFCILYSKLAHIVKLMLHPGQRAVVGQRVLVEGVAPGPDEILPTGRVKNIIPLTVQHRGRSSSGTALPPRRLGRRRRGHPGGTIETIHNAVTLAEIAVEKGAKALLLPVSCRRQLFDLSDDMATKLDVEYYQDGRDALQKALAD